MQSNNGDLYFRAGIDLDNFNASANAMEQRMKRVTSTVVNDAGQMDDAISRVGGAFTRLVGTAAAAGFVKEMVKVRSEIQSLEVSFKTLLGSEERAMKMMGEIRKFAANTPMLVNDLAGAAQMLLAFNYDAEKVMPTLKALGDVSMGDAQRFRSLTLAFSQMSSAGKLMGQDLLQMINAGFNPLAIMAEKTGKSITELKEEMSKGKISADMVTQAFMDATGEGGKFYNMLEQQSKTVGGAISNVQGALTDMFNELGEKSEGVVYNSIIGVQKMLQNYQEVAKVLGTLVVAYGAAKAARIALNIAQQNGTGIGVLDNTVWTIRAKLLKNELTAETNVTRSIRALRKEQQAQIATLKAQLTEEQNDLVIKRSRIANINTLLTAQQRQRLANIGVTEAHKDYIAIATSVLTADQRVALAKGELTNNTTAYIEALQDEIDSSKPNLDAMRQSVKVAAQEAEQLTAVALSKQKSLSAAKAELAAARAEGNQKKINIAQSKVERLTDETSIARKKALAAQRKKNAVQAELEAAARRQNVVAGKAEITTDTTAAKTKGLWALATGKVTKALHALKAAILSNPIGLIITAVTSAVMVFQHFKRKADEAKEAAKEYAEHMASLKEESDAARIKLGNLTDQIVSITKRKETAKKGTDEYKGAISDEKTVLNQLNSEYGGVFGTYNTLSQWYDVLTTKVSDYIDMLYKQALAEDYLEQAKEIRRQKEILEKEEPSKGFWGGVGGFFRGTWSGVGHGVRNAARGQGGLFNLDELGSDFANGFSIEWDKVFHDEVLEDWNHQLDELDKKEEELLGKARAITEENAEIAKRQNINLNGTTTPSLTPTELSKEEKSKLEKMQEERAKIMADVFAREAELLEAQANTMEDSIERRFKLIEAAYKKELSQIERDELDAKKRFAAAGLDYSSSEEGKQQQSVFEARRKALDKQREEEQREATDGLVDYIKEQYEEYQKWVDMMGKDVADKHYSALVSQGATFKQWLDQQIEALQRKEELSTAEIGYLYDLMEAREESATDFYSKFFSKIQTEAEKAPSLAAKLDVLKKALKDLQSTNRKDANGAKSSLQLQIAQQITQTQEEIDKVFDSKYKKYNRTRIELEKQYLSDIARLSKEGRGVEAENMRRELQAALRDIDTDFLKGLVSAVFKNPTKQNMREAMNTLNSIQNMTLDQFNGQFGADGFQLTQSQLDAIKASISDVNTEIKKLGQGYTLSDAFKDIQNGRVEGDLEKVARGTDFMQSAFSKFASTVSALSNALNELADASNNENLKNTAKTVSQVSSVLNSTSSMAAAGAQIGGGWGALIGGILGLGGGILTEVFKSSAEREERIAQATETGTEFQQEVASQLMNILGAVQSLSDTVTSLNYEQFRKSLLDLIEELKESQSEYYGKDEDGRTYWQQLRDSILGNQFNVGTTQFGDGDMNAIWNRMVAYGFMSEEEARSRRDRALQGSYYTSGWDWWNNLLSLGTEDNQTFDHELWQERTAKSIADYINWMAGQFAERQRQLMQELEDLYNSNSRDSLEYFNKENEVYREQLEYLQFQLKWLEVLGKQDTDEYRELVRQITNLEHEMGESLQNMAEGLYGTDIQSLINDWISIFQEFGDNVDGAFAKIDEGIDQMIANMLLKRKVIEPLFTQISDIFDNYAQEVGDDHEYTEDDFRELGERIRGARGDAYDAYQRYLSALEAAGISIDNLGDTNTMTGSLQNLSEETGGVIAGRMNAMVINQAETTNVLRQSLVVQVETRNHTAQMAEDLRYIKNRMGFSGVGSFNENMNYGYPEV